MLKINFSTKSDYDTYITEQKVNKEKGYLTASERKQLQQMIDNPASYIVAPKEIKVAKPLITNYKQLRIPSLEVTKDDNIAEIIQNLKDGLDVYGGLGISACQLGILKRISYIKVPFVTPEKKIEMKEIILINTEIIEKDKPIIFKGEGCTSFKNLRVNTKRYVFITATNYNEKLESSLLLSQDLEGICIQHEIDHQNGVTIIERTNRK